MISVRPAEGEADYRAIVKMLMAQWTEVGRGPVNPIKAGQYIYRVMTEGAAYVVERDGAAVGSVGLSLIDFWYSDGKFWHEEWLYIAPEQRDGAVLRAIFSELQTLGEITNTTISLIIFNAKRAKITSEIHRDAERFFFMPGGARAIITPAMGDRDVGQIDFDQAD